MEDDFTHSYDEKAEHLIDTLDFNKLTEIKKKDLKDISEEDLEFLGFQKIADEELNHLYCFEDLDHIKVYINRVGDMYELRGYMLSKTMDILTTTQLLGETLTRWKLKM